MAEYSYKAKDDKGKIISSFIEASSKEEAVEEISQLGLFPLSVEPAAKTAAVSRVEIPAVQAAMMRRDVTSFSRQLASLLKSGISVLNAISIIAKQSDRKRFKIVLDNLFTSIKDGKPLSIALAEHPALFDKFYVSMIKVGEENGTLPEILARIVQYRKKQDEIKTRIKGALVYPGIVAVVGFFTVLFVMTNVLPKLLSLIDSIGVDKPKPTLVLMSVVAFLQQYAWLIICVLGLLYVPLRAYLRKKKAVLPFEGLKLKVPVFGRLILESEIVLFSKTLKTSLESGLQLLKSIELAASVMTNGAMKHEMELFYDEIRSGTSLGVMLRKSKLFPVSVGNMIVVGEESGKLTDVLEQIAEDYETHVDETVKLLLTLIEPLIILVLGGLVGFIAIALLLPVFNLNVMVK